MATDDKTVKKTRGLRRYYILGGVVLLIFGSCLLGSGIASMSCAANSSAPTGSCQYSTPAFKAGVFGGLLLGGGVAYLVLGLLLGKTVFVTS
jgi:hypothetical protein